MPAMRARMTLAALVGLLAMLTAPAFAQVGPVQLPYNKHWTTQYGPAYADIMVVPKGQKTSPNMLSCKPPGTSDFAYALCYYSGPAAPTGPAGNPALPCTLSADRKSASCVCYKITPAEDQGQAYQIDINAILDLNIYKSTVKACGHDGSLCAPTTSSPAPACDAVNGGTMMPHDKIVSVFSLVKNSHYTSKPVPESTQCTAGLYAGCMTAPCVDSGMKTSNGQPLVTCKCPTYKGPFEIGQAGMSCNANTIPPPAGNAQTKPASVYVWSAAHTVYQDDNASRAPAKK